MSLGLVKLVLQEISCILEINNRFNSFTQKTSVYEKQLINFIKITEQ